MICALAIFTLTLTIDLVIDIRKWKREDYNVIHNNKWVRVVGLVPAAILGSLFNWWLLIPSTGMALSYYWLLFDGIYNLARGFNWWYTGSDDPDDANTDNFLQRLKLWQHIAIKLGLIAGSTILYIIIYHGN